RSAASMSASLVDGPVLISREYPDETKPACTLRVKICEGQSHRCGRTPRESGCSPRRLKSRDELSPFRLCSRPFVGVEAISRARPGGQARPVLLDIAGVAERLSVTERFVRRLVFERRIPFLKIGHFVRFEPAEIERWIVETRVPKAPT